MSLAACLKEIICDPDVTEAQAIANALEFLQEQTKARYGNDPAQILELKKLVSEAQRPYCKDAVNEVVKAIDQQAA